MSVSVPTDTEPPLRLFTRKDYHAMAEASILSERDRVELIKGRIISMLPIGTWHHSASMRVDRVFQAAYGATALISCGNSVALGDDSEPQPDIMVLRWRDDFYAHAQPEAQDVILLVELSDSSRAFDLGAKLDLYAENGIRDYWVVDTKGKCVRVFRDPKEGRYVESSIFHSSDTIPLPECAGKTVAVTDLGV